MPRGETELVVVIDADLDTLTDPDLLASEVILTNADPVLESVAEMLPLNDPEPEAEVESDTDILVELVWLTELDSKFVCVFVPEYVELTDAVKDGVVLIEYVGVFEDDALTLSVTFTKLLVFVFVVAILRLDIAESVIDVFPVRDPEIEAVDDFDVLMDRVFVALMNGLHVVSTLGELDADNLGDLELLEEAEFVGDLVADLELEVELVRVREPAAEFDIVVLFVGCELTVLEGDIVGVRVTQDVRDEDCVGVLQPEVVAVIAGDAVIDFDT